MLHRDLSAALEFMLNHKLHIQGKLKNVEGRITHAVDELRTLPPMVL
jgi:hypothetical protein